MIVELTKEQVSGCRALATLRQNDNVKKGKKDADGFRGDPLRLHFIGLLGECAAHTVLGGDWNDFTDSEIERKKGDVGKYEVRTTEYSSGGLLIKPRDVDDRIYVCVRRVNKKEYKFEIAGWMKGKEAKQERFWKAYVRKPCYIVPAYKLNDIELLKQKVKGQIND